MFTFEEYLMGWLVYIGLIVGVLAVFWWLTRALPWLYCKQVLRLIVSAVLLVPVRVPDTVDYWAPAWIVGVLELIFSGFDAFMSIGQTLLIAVAIALCVYALLTLVKLFLFRKKQEHPSQ